MMTKTVRHLAVDILNQTSAGQAFASPLINDCLDKNALSGTPDGRLLTHLVYGVLRHQGHLDWILAKFYRGDFEKLDESIKNILRLGISQLKFSDRLPAFAVVNEAVNVAKIIHPEKSALVNAILRNFLRRGQEISFPSFKKDPAGHIAALHSHPLWLVKAWIKIFGNDQTKSLCQADNELPPLTLRVNTLKISRDEIKQQLALAGFAPEETRFSPDGLILTAFSNPVQKTHFFEEGYFRLQDEAAQLISYLVGPDISGSVLDACAGAGGKATHLAAILKNKGRIVAIDRSAERISELGQEALRMGINIIDAQKGDFSGELPESLKGNFDCVLVDAPCSGLGTLRRNPEIKWRTTEKDIINFAAAQKIILKNTAAAVKKGGRLIYCTCSLLPQENENVVEDFLRQNPDFAVYPPENSINKQFIDDRGFFHTCPDRYNMDGFFAVVLKSK